MGISFIESLMESLLQMRMIESVGSMKVCGGNLERRIVPVFVS